MDASEASSTLSAFPPELRANPVFRLEQQRLKWPRTPIEFKRFRKNVLWSIFGLTLVWWILGHIDTNGTAFFIVHGNQILLLFMISIASTLLSSFYAVVTTIGSIHHQIESGNWDNLRITPLSGTAIVTAYYAIAQTRARRLTIIEVGLRIATLMPLLFDLIQIILSKPYGFVVLFALAIPGWILYLVLIEPYYRMLILVALSLAASLTFRGFGVALLAGLIVIALVHILPLALVIGIPYALTATPDISRATSSALVCLIPLCYFGAAYLMFIGYHWLRQKALLWAVQKAS
jgi:hypothetical protein